MAWRTERIAYLVAVLAIVGAVTAASPNIRWVLRHPQSIRNIVRVRTAAARIRQYRSTHGDCPPKTELQSELGSSLKYDVLIEWTPSECVLRFQANNDGFDVSDHFYFVVRDVWAEQGDMFRGGEVWQRLSAEERRRLERLSPAR